MNQYDYVIVDTTTNKTSPITMGKGRTIESTFAELKTNQTFLRVKKNNGSRQKFVPMVNKDGTVIGRNWTKI